MLEAIMLFKTTGVMTAQLSKKPWKNCRETRVNQCRVFTMEPRIELPIKFFSIRAPKEWNQLPDEAVSSPSLDCFKAGQDKSWAAQHFDIFKLT